MQKGRIYQHGGQWMFRYKEPVFVNGAKVWKDKYEKLAAVDQYKTAAQVEKDFTKKLHDLRAGLDSAKFTPSTTQLVSDFIEQIYFPKQSEPGRLKDSTVFGYRHLYNRHVKPNLNGEVMRDFKLPTAQKLMDKIAAAVPLSSKSLSHIKWFLKAVFDVARTEEAYDPGAVNPFAEAKIPKTRKEQQQPTRYATLDNILDMIDALEEPAATVVSVAAFSGLRKSEIQGLRWEDLKNGELHVRRTAWRTTKIEESTKTAASKSSVPVIKILAAHLEAHWDRFPPEGFIFLGPKLGKPLDLHNLASRVIRPALEKCATCRKSRLDHAKESHAFALDKARSIWCGWHGFRRGLATNLHTLGVPDIDVQRILRHADVKVTQQSYIKVEDHVRQAAMKKFERALNKRRRARRRK
jgi:integrase